jgi:DinB superfamily
MPMDAKLDELQTTLLAAVRDMTPEDLARHPEGRWSTAEILEHLNLTYRGSLKNFGRCLASEKPSASHDRRSKRWQRLFVTRLGYFPPGRKSPSSVEPRGMPVQQVKVEILENIVHMDQAIASWKLALARNSRSPTIRS